MYGMYGRSVGLTSGIVTMLGWRLKKYRCIFERSLPYVRIILDRYTYKLRIVYIYIHIFMYAEILIIVSDLTISNMRCVDGLRNFSMSSC